MTDSTRTAAIENDREFKAHIYQQLVELQPYLSPESQIAVLVQLEEHDEFDEHRTEYSLKLVATIGEFKIEAEGRDTDLYDALAIAKADMYVQLDEIYAAAIDQTERNNHIQNLLDGQLTIH